MNWREKIHHASDNGDGHFQSNLDRIQKMNNSIAYIENHLDSKIDYNEAAKIAHCSVYHFQRFFYGRNTFV